MKAKPKAPQTQPEPDVIADASLTLGLFFLLWSALHVIGC